MSKLFMYVLDKFVWMLLITALTTQALQIAGILESPKGLQDITYREGNEYNFQLSVRGETRGKRETAERSKVIDSLFNNAIRMADPIRKIERLTSLHSVTKLCGHNDEEKSNKYIRQVDVEVQILNENMIPIQTLTAVNNLVQNSRPALRSLRDFAVKRFMKPKTTTTTAEPPESNLHKRSYPVYVRPKEDEAKYAMHSP